MLILYLSCDLRTQPDCFKGSQRPCPSPYALLTDQDVGLFIPDLGCVLRAQPDYLPGLISLLSARPSPSLYAATIFFFGHYQEEVPTDGTNL